MTSHAGGHAELQPRDHREHERRVWHSVLILLITEGATSTGPNNSDR